MPRTSTGYNSATDVATRANPSSVVTEENMTVCVDKCIGGRDCKTYIIPFDTCFSPPRMFPKDEQWGEFDCKVSQPNSALVASTLVASGNLVMKSL